MFYDYLTLIGHAALMTLGLAICSLIVGLLLSIIFTTLEANKYVFIAKPTAIIIALLKGNNNNTWRLAVANIVGGILVVYTFGVLWLSFVTGMGLEKAFMVGVLPYIPGDLFKVFVATLIGVAVNKQLPKLRNAHG